MSYKIPLHTRTGKDRIFIVNRSAVDNRLDAQYHRVNLDLSGFVKLSSVATVKGGKRIPKGFGYSNLTTPYHYLRVVDMDSDMPVDVSSLKNISKDVFNILERYELNGGELAISIAGTIGKTTVLKDIPEGKRVVLTENCAKILVKSSVKLLPDYLRICLELPVVKQQLELYHIRTTIPKLGLDKIVQIKIPPIPGIQRQKEIVEYINDAYTRKLSKEACARRLLEGIDDYILSELRIHIPKIENDIDSRMFIIQSRELKGRYSPCLYKDAVSLYSSAYENVPLYRLADINPDTRFPLHDKNMEISFVAMDSVDEIYAEIRDNRNCTVAQSKGFTRFQEGDLLWAKITPCMENGKSAIANNLINGYGCGSTEFHVIRPKTDNLLVGYLHYLLHMRLVRQTAKLYFGGSAGQQRVANDFLYSFIVPLPSRAEQQKIIDHIADIMDRAKSMQKEGKTILENAKCKVEQMIMDN